MPNWCAIAEETAGLGAEVRLLLHGKRKRCYRIYVAIHQETETVRIFHIRHWARKPIEADELSDLMDESIDSEFEDDRIQEMGIAEGDDNFASEDDFCQPSEPNGPGSSRSTRGRTRKRGPGPVEFVITELAGFGGRVYPGTWWGVGSLLRQSPGIPHFNRVVDVDGEPGRTHKAGR